jgi:hypothetical protein
LIDCLRKNDDIVYKEEFSCPQLYQCVVVGSDGKVMMCSNSEVVIIRDADEQGICEIWHGEPINRVRETHVMPNETATVKSRTTNVENYVNRAQKVGK